MKDLVTVVAIGSSGHGMSSFLNRLGGEQHFAVTTGLRTQTIEAEAWYTQINGQRVCLVDTPGVNWDRVSYQAWAEKSDLLFYTLQTACSYNSFKRLLEIKQLFSERPFRVVLTNREASADEQEVREYLEKNGVQYIWEDEVTAEVFSEWLRAV